MEAALEDELMGDFPFDFTPTSPPVKSPGKKSTYVSDGECSSEDEFDMIPSTPKSRGKNTAGEDGGDDVVVAEASDTKRGSTAVGVGKGA